MACTPLPKGLSLEPGGFENIQALTPAPTPFLLQPLDPTQAQVRGLHEEARKLALLGGDEGPLLRRSQQLTCELEDSERARCCGLAKGPADTHTQSAPHRYPRDLLGENKVAGPGLADAPPRRSVHSRAVTRLQRPPCYPGPPCPPKHNPDSTCRPGHVLTQTQPPQWLGWTAPTLMCPVRSLVPEDFAQYHLHAKPLMDSPSQRRPECPTPHARANPQEPGYPKKQLLQRPPRLPVRS